MIATNREIGRLSSQIDQTARGAVAVAERVRRATTPELIQTAQDGIRGTLLWVESRIRLCQHRRRVRRVRLKRAVRHRSAHWKHDVYQPHLAALQRRDALLARLRSVLKQAADSLAWVVLREDQRIILPMFVKRTHHLPEGIGLIGQVQVLGMIHDSGQFLALENDLTRILGVGDLTIVSNDGNWTRPLCIELKSRGDPEVGAEVEIDFATAVAETGPDADMFNRLQKLLGMKERRVGEGRTVPRRQAHELVESAQSTVDLQRQITTVLRTAGPGLWPCVQRVGDRALTVGSAFDIAEADIAYLCIRVTDTEASMMTMRQLLKKLEYAGFGQGMMHVTSNDLTAHDELAGFALPVPLWPVSPFIRANVLSGDLYLACVFHPELWTRAMNANGIDLSMEGREWVVSKAGKTARFGAVEVLLLTYGFAFSGLSPVDLCHAAAAALTKAAA